MLQQRPEFLALWDLTMASFNTVAGCVLASALFAMVVGKIANAVVHPHKLEKPALAVVDEAPTTETAAAAPAEELPPIGPLLAGANVEAGKLRAETDRKDAEIGRASCRERVYGLV